MQRTSASLAELDAVLSLASAAVDLGLVRPNMVEENVVVIKAGRHPLQELVVDAFIPNDTLLASAAGGTVALITGANYSGKSVYLKQVIWYSLLCQNQTKLLNIWNKFTLCNYYEFTFHELSFMTHFLESHIVPS